MSYIERLFQAQRAHLPRDERQDVNQVVVRELLGGLTRGDFVPADEVLDWVHTVRRQEASLQKAVALQSFLRPGGFLSDGTAANRGRGPAPRGHQSVLYINELGVLGPGLAERWAEKPVGGGLEFLKFMSEQLDVHRALVLTRIRQVHAFLRPYREDDNNPLGYRWVRRDGERMTDDDERACRRFDRILANSGTEDDPDRRKWDHRRRTLQGFVDVVVNDTLTADACPIEVELDQVGRPLGWYNIPFETVRLAHEDGYEGDDRIVAVQIHPQDRTPLIGFERGQILYEVRNPRSDLTYHDYGQSELEHFIRCATSYLHAFDYNAAFLNRRQIPRGFLTLYGRFDKRQLNFFKQQWNAMVRGAANLWNLPVLVSESKNEGGAAYTPLDTATNEMFMTKWLIFLVSVLCALYGMDPVELNMEAFTAKVSSLSGKDTAEKLQSSKDRGFIPLMHWLEGLINDHLVRRFTKKYAITWVGLFPADEQRKAARQDKVLTVDEMRAIDGEEPHPDADIGAAPVNPTLMSLHVMKLQQRMQQAMTAPYGGGAGGGPDPHFGLPASERVVGLPGGDGADGQGGAARRSAPGEGGPPGAQSAEHGARGLERAGLAKARGGLTVTIRELPPEVW